MSPTLLTAAVGIILFAGLSLLAITLYRLAHRILTPPAAPPPPSASTPAKPRDSLTNDPKLMAFFKAVDPDFRVPASATYSPPAAPKSAMHAAPPEAVLNPIDASFVVDLPSTGLPAIIRERRDPEVIRDGVLPTPSSVRPDPIELKPRQPSSPIATETSADPDLAALVQIWTGLSPRDRRELRRLAEMKRDSA